MDTGWIRLHRKVRDNSLWPKNRRFTALEAWLDVLMSANHAQTKTLLGISTPVSVERGQFITTQVKLAERWRWNRKTVKKFLLILKKDEMLDIETSKGADIGFTLITIRNYNKYQDKENDALDIEIGSKGTSDGQSKGLLMVNNKKDKNEKKKDMSRKPDSVSPPIVEKTIRRMNELAGTSYRSNTKVTAKHINARISEGYTLEDFETVLESKWHEWKNNPDMRKFYRPQTLFSPEHFEAYLQAAKLNGNGSGVDRKPEVDPWDAYKDE